MRTGARVWGGTICLTACLLGAGCAEVLSQLDLQPSADSSTPEDGLREALRVGTARAVNALGRTDGYLENPEVRIPLPEKLEKLGKALKTIGAGSYVDEFVTSMNRAAEAAAPAARSVFVDAIREMSFEDALTILRGDAHEATDFFRERSGPKLAELFEPIVAGKLDEVGATRKFGELVDETAKLPFLERPAFDLNAYVSELALDGLFDTLEKEEEKIRKDPLARTTELLKKYFGVESR